MQCRNNLKQMGVACQIHLERLGYFPSGGWGWDWVGDADSGSGKRQPGGWLYNILPGLELNALHDTGKGAKWPTEKQNAGAILVQSPLQVMCCPSQRPMMLYPRGTGNPGTYVNVTNGGAGLSVARGDYAACCGSGARSEAQAGGGPGSINDSASYNWPKVDDPANTDYMNGVIYQRSMTKPKDIRRGTSHVIMLGERWINLAYMYNGNDTSDNECMYAGQDNDTQRTTYNPPERSIRIDGVTGHGILLFGSIHAAGAHFVCCDGAVHTISYDVDAKAYKTYGARILAADILSNPTGTLTPLSSEPVVND